MSHESRQKPADCRKCVHVRDVVAGVSAACAYRPGHAPAQSRNWRLIISGPCPFFEQTGAKP